jgi:serine/threonine protein kinase
MDASTDTTTTTTGTPTGHVHEVGRSGHRYAYHYSEEGEGYLFVDFLGSGIQGSAYRVWSTKDGCLYVRKTDNMNTQIAIALGTETTVSERRHAYDKIQGIKSEHIAKPIFSNKYEGKAGGRDAVSATYWEYKNGGNLQRFIQEYRNGGIPERFVWKLLADLLSGLRDLHAADVTHKDLRADNIFVHWPDPDVTAPIFVLGDFGKSKHWDLIRYLEWCDTHFSDYQGRCFACEAFLRQSIVPCPSLVTRPCPVVGHDWRPIVGDGSELL